MIYFAILQKDVPLGVFGRHLSKYFTLSPIVSTRNIVQFYSHTERTQACIILKQFINDTIVRTEIQ